jgi:hypothetical protein
MRQLALASIASRWWIISLETGKAYMLFAARSPDDASN